VSLLFVSFFMVKDYKHINLDYLNEMSAGSKDLKRDLINMFIKQVPIFNEQMNSYYIEKDYLSLGKLAHKIKSSVAMMGIGELTTDMKTLENIAREGIDVEKYPIYINKFKKISSEAVKELQSILTMLS